MMSSFFAVFVLHMAIIWFYEWVQLYVTTSASIHVSQPPVTSHLASTVFFLLQPIHNCYSPILPPTILFCIFSILLLPFGRIQHHLFSTCAPFNNFLSIIYQIIPGDDATHTQMLTFQTTIIYHAFQHIIKIVQAHCIIMLIRYDC